MLRVQLQEGQSLRDLAQQHLGDPDLWAEILRMNGLTVGDVRPGIELTIPIGRIAAANRALDDALQQIRSATEQGARLFAPNQIARAISLRDTALAQRKAGAWEAAEKLATDARAHADEALAAARPPVAVAGTDRVVAPGEPVAFDGTGSQAGERPIARYLWDFYDGSGGDGPSPSHVYEAPGRYIVTLRVEDDSSPPCNFATNQQIVQVNAQPVAVAGEAQRVSVGETVSLDGARGYDVDGAVVAHEWNLGDGSSATGAQIEHAYQAPGSYVARLTVEDDAGVANSRGSDDVRILVNAPPVAEAGPDRHVAIGEVITFDAGGSRDPDGTLIGYAWTFGDGARGDGQVVQYAYHRSGVYQVGLAVRDDSGTSSNGAIDTLTVIVNEPPVADAGPDQTVSSSEVRFDGSGSHDPDGTIAGYAWDFGDGASGSGPMPVHVYESPGSYPVRLTVTDDSGTLRNTASATTRVVVNAPPIADAGPDLIGAPGQELTFVAAGSIDPDGDVAEYLWSFKNGAAATGPRSTTTRPRS